jgi:hypothetical protein
MPNGAYKTLLIETLYCLKDYVKKEVEKQNAIR